MKANKPQTKQEFFEDLLSSIDDKQETVDFVKQRRIVSKLASLRSSKGLTQSELASQAGCTQGTISKLESGTDSGVTLENLEAYAKATDSDITILISERGRSLADQIKHHAFWIRAAFMKLAKLAHQDDLIAQGVAQLHAEAFENINRMLSETAQKLPVSADNGMPYIEIVGDPAACDESAITTKSGRKKRNQHAAMA